MDFKRTAKPQAINYFRALMNSSVLAVKVRIFVLQYGHPVSHTVDR